MYIDNVYHVRLGCKIGLNNWPNISGVDLNFYCLGTFNPKLEGIRVAPLA